MELLRGSGGEDSAVGGTGDLKGYGGVGIAARTEEGGREDFLVF